MCEEKRKRVGVATAGRNPKTRLPFISWISQLQYLSSRLECAVAGIRVLSGTVSDMEVGIKWVEEQPEMQFDHIHVECM